MVSLGGIGAQSGQDDTPAVSTVENSVVRGCSTRQSENNPAPANATAAEIASQRGPSGTGAV